MISKDLINDLKELEGLAMLMEEKATRLRKEAHKAIEKLAGVSTPAVQKGLSEVAARAVANRNKFLQKKK